MKRKIDPKVLLQTRYDDLPKVFPKKDYGYTRGELRAMQRSLKKESTQNKNMDAFSKFLVKGRTEAEIRAKFNGFEEYINTEYEGLNLFVQRNVNNEKVYILLPDVINQVEIASKIWKYHIAEDDGRRQPYMAVQFPDSVFEGNKRLVVAPIFDVHFGNIGHKKEKFLSYIRWLKSNPNIFAVLGGDLMENALDDGRGMSYDQNNNPQSQIDWMITALAPIAHKILLAIPGNHEWRTYKKAGIDPMKFIAEHLKIPYFDGPVFLDVLAGGYRWTTYISHGYGNSQTKGGKMNSAGKPRKFTSFVHFILSGHVHDPVVNSETCIVIDPINMRLTYPQQWTIIAPSFLRWEGTYAYRAGYPPPGSGGVIMEMASNGEYRGVLQ